MNAEMLKDGWCVNGGNQPCDDDVFVDILWKHDGVQYFTKAGDWGWCDSNITHWRPHKAESLCPPKSLEDAYEHLNTGHWLDMNKNVKMSAKDYIESVQPSVEQFENPYNPPKTCDLGISWPTNKKLPVLDVEQPLGIPLSRVCKAFEAITGHPMSEEHAEVFVSVLEMCKGFSSKYDEFAQKEDA